VSIFDLPKIDGHCHVLDPQRFAYPAAVAYRPQGQGVPTCAPATGWTTAPCSSWPNTGSLQTNANT